MQFYVCRRCHPSFEFLRTPLSIAGTGEHQTSTEALWALRDFMMHEALGVVKIM